MATLTTHAVMMSAAYVITSKPARAMKSLLCPPARAKKIADGSEKLAQASRGMLGAKALRFQFSDLYR